MLHHAKGRGNSLALSRGAVTNIQGESKVEAIAGAIGLRANCRNTKPFAANCTALWAVHRGAPPKARLPLAPPRERARQQSRPFAWDILSLSQSLALFCKRICGEVLAFSCKRGYNIFTKKNINQIQMGNASCAKVRRACKKRVVQAPRCAHLSVNGERHGKTIQNRERFGRRTSRKQRCILRHTDASRQGKF